MKATFIKSMKSKGKRGEAKNTPGGHAQNFLIKNDYAREAASSNLNTSKRVQKAEKDAYETERVAAEDIEKKLENDKTIINPKSKAGTDPYLFGSISSEKIVERLEKQYGIKVDRRKLESPEPIKPLEHTNVPVKLSKGIEAVICVRITE